MITARELFDARFAELEPALRDEIFSFGVEREVPAGTYVMQSGLAIQSTLLIIDGRVKIYREGEDGEELLMYFLEPGDACAISIMCAIDKGLSQVTGVTETTCTFINLPFDRIGKWMQEYPSWDQFVIRNYRKRFQELLFSLDQIAFRSLDERLVFYLKRRQEVDGDDLKISHQDIARDMNSAREVVSRLLKKMEQLGAVRLERGHVHILNLDLVL